MGKVIITGVDSTIGANLALSLGRHFECLGLYHNRAAAPAGCISQHCDWAHQSELLQIVRDASPDWVIHCGSLATNAWEHSPDGHSPHHENELVSQLAAVTSKLHSPLTVISSDAVYVGPRLFHEESCVPTGQTSHARFAIQMEETLKRTSALIVRTHAYGWSPLADRPSFAESLALRLAEGESIAMDGLRYATPILISDLAELLVKACELKLTGLYHITGAERTNASRFVRELALALGIESYQTPSGDAATAPGKVPVMETSLNTRRARRDLGCPMPMLREGLERFAAQRVNGYVDALRAGSQQPITPARAA